MLLKVFAAHECKDDQNISGVTCSDLEFQQPAKGKFGWYELMTSDTKAAGKFYSDVVGWSAKEVSAGDVNPYTTFNLGDIAIAGMLHIPGHTAWIGYIA